MKVITMLALSAVMLGGFPALNFSMKQEPLPESFQAKQKNGVTYVIKPYQPTRTFIVQDIGDVADSGAYRLITIRRDDGATYPAKGSVADSLYVGEKVLVVEITQDHSPWRGFLIAFPAGLPLPNPKIRLEEI